MKGNEAPRPQETELNEFDSHALNSDAHTGKFALGWKKPLLSSRERPLDDRRVRGHEQA